MLDEMEFAMEMAEMDAVNELSDNTMAWARDTRLARAKKVGRMIPGASDPARRKELEAQRSYELGKAADNSVRRQNILQQRKDRRNQKIKRAGSFVLKNAALPLVTYGANKLLSRYR